MTLCARWRCWPASTLAFALAALPAAAQSTLQALQEELKQAEQQHNDVTAQNLGTFFSQVDSAMTSPEAAIALYQNAGGTMPDPAPVSTEHESETVTEKDARMAQDRATAKMLGTALELHCGILHYAALFVTKPDQKGLAEEWGGWLKNAAAVYPELAVPASPPATSSAPGGASQAGDASHHHHHDSGAKPFSPADIKSKTMKDSIIGKSLGFNSWGDKEQGGWAVKDIPRFYKAQVLDPLRATPNEATLAAWDAYIAMMNADEPDSDKWTQATYPGLFFERSCDAYTAAPDVEKLEGLVKFITANNTNPQFATWDERVSGLLKDFAAKRGTPLTPAGDASAPPPAVQPPANPNEQVTTEKQGDATIITTHHLTNAP
jgi:hypothetical protein